MHVFCAIVLFVTSVSAQSPTSATPQKWEYRVVHLNEISGTNEPYGSHNVQALEAGLNEFGRDGWQLVGFEAFQNEKIAIFKRPLTQ